MNTRHFRLYLLLLVLSALLPIKTAFAAATLKQTYAAALPSGFAVTVKRIRVAADGTVYALGTLATGLSKISADGNSVTTTNYSASIPTPTGADFSVSGNTLYIATNSGINGRLLRFDVSGTIASLVASTNQSGAGTVALFPPSSVYSSRSSSIKSYNTTLSASSTTSSVSSVISRMAVSNSGILYYLSSTGTLRRSTDFTTATDTTLISGLGNAVSANSLVIAPDSSAAYFGYTTSIRKYSLPVSGSSSLLWTQSYPNTLAGMDVDTSGNIYAVKIDGTTSVYSSINPVSTFSATPATSNGSVYLSWNTGVSDSDFTGVTIRRDTTDYPTSPTANTSVVTDDTNANFLDTGLSPATTYYYTIFNKTIDGYYGSPVTANTMTPPSAPTLSAALTSSNMSQINLNWDVPSGTDTFTLQRSFNDDGYTDVQTGIANSVTSYSDTGLMDGTYTYQIFAIDVLSHSSDAGTSSTLTIDTTAPNAPVLSATLATSNGSTIDLSWDVPSTTSTFTLQRSVNGGGYAAVQTGIAASTTALSQTGLSDGTYTYKLFAVDAVGNISTAGTSSTLTVDTTAPSAPSLSATLATLNGSTINLSWNMPAGTDTFNLQRSVNGGGYTNVQTGIASSTTALSQGGLSDGTYTYKIFAVDAVGNVSTAGTSSTLTVDTTAPNAPTSVAADVDGMTIVLTWINPVSDFDSITIRRSTSTFPATITDDTLVAVNLTGTSFEDEDLAFGTYYYSLFAKDARGNVSVAANVTVVNAGVTPTMSTGDAEEVNDDGAILIGTIDDIGTSDVMMRGFEYGETTSYEFTAEEDGTFAAEIFELAVEDLDCGTTYHYRAFATNETGTAYGEDKTFATSACSGTSSFVVSVQAPTSPVQINSTTTFEVTLDNLSNSDIEEAALSFTLSDNIAFVSAEVNVTSDASESVANPSISQSVSCSGTNPVSCNLDTIPANSSVVMSITVRALSEGPMSLVVTTGNEESSGGSATTGPDGGAVDTRAFSGGTIGCALIKESSETLH